MVPRRHPARYSPRLIRQEVPRACLPKIRKATKTPNPAPSRAASTGSTPSIHRVWLREMPSTRKMAVSFAR